MKKALSALLVLIIVLPILIVCFSVPASAETLYKHKVVSVLFDDSGSMQGANKYMYASYALQSFCGMLNSEDQLYISYMSDVSKSSSGNPYIPPKVDLSDDDSMKAAVESIQGIGYNAETPYSMIYDAFHRLTYMDDITDAQTEQYWLAESTEYWLVVITDGIFREKRNGSTSYSDIPEQELLERLNADCKEYLNQTMPNGTHPQITFMGIGQDIVLPDLDQSGIYTYSAADATKITSTMSQIADRISGRKRLEPDVDYEMVDGTNRAIVVHSDIPLLNITVFTQRTNAEITGVTHDGKMIDVSRTSKLQSGSSAELTGRAYMIGDSQTPLDEGDYTITFTEDISLDNIVVLFEPALEAEVNIQVNDTELELDKIKNLNEYLNNNMMAGDKISLSYDIVEMGGSDEIPDLSDLSPTYTISVYEDGKPVKEVSGKGEVLTDYKVKQVKTKIVAGITIEGFSPIVKTIEFTPKAYVPTYTVAASISDEKCVLKEDVSENRDVQVSFTVFADGVQITDLNVVKGLSPVITTSVSGNDGDVTYTDDGKIVFTPNKASARPGKDAVFDVNVTCTIKTLRGEISASEKYSVDASIFEVVFVAPDKTIKKTELYGNTVAATFYVTKEGVKLNKSEVGDLGESFTYTLNRSRKDLQINASVSDDGAIIITPSSKEEHKKGFFLFYWADYAKLNGSDIEITLEHQRGTATGTLDVVGGGGAYVFFNVLLWLGIEILVAVAIMAYIIRFATKSRFSSKAKIYYGKIEVSGGSYTLNLNHKKNLTKDNKYVWNPFKPITVELMRTSFTALYGGMIRCHKAYFEANVTPIEGSSKTGKELYDICKAERKGVEIQPITGDETIEKHLDKGITGGENSFYVIPNNPKAAQGVEVQEAYVFCYVIEK